MFDITLKDDFFDDTWFKPALGLNKAFREIEKIMDKGLSPMISRPHNLYTYKDEMGNIIGNKMQIVTTPFSKDEVSVEILNNVLTVKCGKENKKDEDLSSCVYHGISSQSYEFSIKLSDKIDQNKVEAKNEDGILTINLPFIPEEPKEEPRKITVL